MFSVNFYHFFYFAWEKQSSSEINLETECKKVQNLVVQKNRLFFLNIFVSNYANIFLLIKVV